MNIRKFVGPTARDALHRVKTALGADAIILSNKRVAEGIEIAALAYDDTEHLDHLALGPLTRAYPSLPPSANSPVIVTPTIEIAPLEDKVSQMMARMDAMHGMLEEQMTELSWTSMPQRQPHKSHAMKELLRSGFSAHMARYLISKMPSNINNDEAMAWLHNILVSNITTLSSEDALLDKGGIFALVGPTGVGKTTTLAKMAARCVMRNGTEKLGLITTDGYRIGAPEQLRIYGKILGVMVHSVKDEADLRIALSELKNKQTILIDTAGVGQRDDVVAEQIALLTGTGSKVQRLLCLNATSTCETLSEVVRAYTGPGLAGAVMTKLDEAATTGNVLDVVLRHKLCLYYVATGQRVPEDIHLANKSLLIHQALNNKRIPNSFTLQDDELSSAVAAGPNNITVNEQGAKHA